MLYIKKNFSTTYEIKKSKFLAHICSYKDFKHTLERLKIVHPKASHFVYAYRYYNDYFQIEENLSDDGEPKGTSGRSALKVLIGNELINVAIIIVRYFGGIKLGRGGLSRAYTEATNIVCKVAETYIYEQIETFELNVEYSKLSKVEYLLQEFGILTSEKHFEDVVRIVFQTTKDKYENLLLAI